MGRLAECSGLHVHVEGNAHVEGNSGNVSPDQTHKGIDLKYV